MFNAFVVKRVAGLSSDHILLSPVTAHNGTVNPKHISILFKRSRQVVTKPSENIEELLKNQHMYRFL
jgi:hypothetical protein